MPKTDIGESTLSLALYCLFNASEGNYLGARFIKAYYSVAGDQSV